MAKLVADNKGSGTATKASSDQTAKITALQQKLEEQTKKLNAVIEEHRNADKVRRVTTSARPPRPSLQ
eukprot:4406259-Pyramimonas_sp.AAC.2